MRARHMRNEILEQPEVLRRTLECTRSFLEGLPLDPGKFTTLHLTGCGDMDFSARAAAWLAMGDGPLVRPHRSMDLRWRAGFFGRDDLLVAASFSGRTPRTVEAARLAKKHGAAVLGITGNPGSPLTDAVDHVLLLDTGRREELKHHAYAGYHHNVPQTKTFTAVLFAELLLLRAAGCLSARDGTELDRLPDRFEECLPKIEEGIQRYMKHGFREVERVSILGSGPWRPLAAFGAAKFLEMAIPARHQCIEENNHLEMFVTDERELLVFLAPDRASFTRAQEMLGPYGRFDALRLVLAPASITGCNDPCFEINGVPVITLPEGDPPADRFLLALALQLLSCAVGEGLRRDIDQWVGGVRVALIEALGQKLVRETSILDAF